MEKTCASAKNNLEVPPGEWKRGIGRVIASVAIGMAASNPAWAGPPFVTDDPAPVDYQRWEVNYAVEGSWRRGEASAGIPSIDVNYGFAADVQLHIQPEYSYERSGSISHFGIDDTEIGVKYRFLNIKHDDASFMISFYPLYNLPTGDRKLGPGRGKGQLFLPVWVQRDSDKWTFYGGTGYRVNPGADNKNSVFIGGTILYKVTESLQLGGEIFHETPTAVGEKSSGGFNLGGSYNLARNYSLLFSAGNGLNGDSSTNRHSAFLALQARY